MTFAAIDEKVIGEALALRDRGEFEKASQSLQAYLDQTTTSLQADEKRRVEFEIERIRRIRMDYKLTREKLLEQLKRRIPDFTDAEFDTFERDGKFDVQVIDGHKLYVNSSASNLLLRVPELRKRQKNPASKDTYRKLYAHMQRVRAAQKLSKSNLLMPQDWAVTYTLIVNKNEVPEGKTIRCWLPYVHAFPFQSDAYILSSEPADHTIAPPEFPHRTIYLERVAKKDEPTTFQVQYIYRAFARAFEVTAENILPYEKESWQYKQYIADRKPHLDLHNEELKRLSNEIGGGETNPYRIARKLYDWVANNTIYQFAREYSTLENISYYCASRRAGDCGQHAMLYIALCRLNGIPARWQSGWENFEFVGNNMHDWCEIYLEPFGWLPVDVDMAVNFIHSGNDVLDTTQTRELVDFMFCNMDHYRLATNSEYGAPLFPAKQDFRSETVDFQRGEVEAEGKNMYFDKWDYEMDIHAISSEEALAIAKKFQPAEVPLPPVLPKQDDPVTTAVASVETTGATTMTIVSTSTTTGVVVETQPIPAAPVATPAAAAQSTTAPVAAPAIATPVAGTQVTTAPVAAPVRLTTTTLETSSGPTTAPLTPPGKPDITTATATKVPTSPAP